MIPGSAQAVTEWTEVCGLTVSRLDGDQQKVAVEAEQHGQTGVELSQRGAFHKGLEGGGH